MEEKLSPLAKGIMDGLEEALKDVQGIPVDGMRKTTVYIEPGEKKPSGTVLDFAAHEPRYMGKPNAAVL